MINEEEIVEEIVELCSEDKMEYFAISKMIQVNLKGNTITHEDTFGYDQSYLNQIKNTSNHINTPPNYASEFTISRINYEYIKNPKFVCIDKQKLESIFKSAFENKVPNSESDFTGEHPLFKHLEKNLNFLKYDKLLSYNSAIMKNRDLIKKLKESKIKVNFPVLFNQIEDKNSDYISVLNELTSTIENLKKAAETQSKPSMTNITINNTVSSSELQFLNQGSANQQLSTLLIEENGNLNAGKIAFNNQNEKSARSKKGTASSFKVNKSTLLDEDDDLKSKIKNLEENLTQLKDDEEKKLKMLEQTLLERFSTEIELLKLKLEEKDTEITRNSINLKTKNHEKMNDLIILLMQAQESTKDYENYVDKRLISNLITKILCKTTSSKLKVELIENLSLLLKLDNQDRKLMGLSPKNSESYREQCCNNYSPFREVSEKLCKAIDLLRLDSPLL